MRRKEEKDEGALVTAFAPVARSSGLVAREEHGQKKAKFGCVAKYLRNLLAVKKKKKENRYEEYSKNININIEFVLKK